MLFNYRKHSGITRTIRLVSRPCQQCINLLCWRKTACKLDEKNFTNQNRGFTEWCKLMMAELPRRDQEPYCCCIQYNINRIQYMQTSRPTLACWHSYNCPDKTVTALAEQFSTIWLLATLAVIWVTPWAATASIISLPFPNCVTRLL